MTKVLFAAFCLLATLPQAKGTDEGNVNPYEDQFQVLYKKNEKEIHNLCLSIGPKVQKHEAKLETLKPLGNNMDCYEKTIAELKKEIMPLNVYFNPNDIVLTSYKLSYLQIADDVAYINSFKQPQRAQLACDFITMWRDMFVREFIKRFQ